MIRTLSYGTETCRNYIYDSKRNCRYQADSRVCKLFGITKKLSAKEVEGVREKA